jgi:hypothetical protein
MLAGDGGHLRAGGRRHHRGHRRAVQRDHQLDRHQQIGKGAICDVDPKWKVNAGVYGTLSQGKNPYVQIGRGAQFQFCRPTVSPLQAVFADGYYAPDLVIFFLMGNATERWAE